VGLEVRIIPIIPGYVRVALTIIALSQGTPSSPEVPLVPLVLGGDVVASFSTLARPMDVVAAELQVVPDTVRSPSQTS
jgi:hypothetical protein